MKRTLDLLVAAGLIVLSSPFWCLIAMAIKLDSRGPVLFRQTRIGRGGKPFEMYKFRSMRHDPAPVHAPIVIEDFHSYVFSPPVHDPRITAVGRLLRTTSLDELPQLWNVLKGEMSLVGPRPELPEIVEQYPNEYSRRHCVCPGITGMAQTRGRSDLTYHQIMLYDLDYVASHSIWRDLAILLRTIGIVATARGAR